MVVTFSYKQRDQAEGVTTTVQREPVEVEEECAVSHLSL